MSIFAIADLHLSLFQPKSMEIFGENWKNHWEKISADWCLKVSEKDVVLIPGDISWAMKLNEAKPDLEAISKLPGKKILLKGNHDYWWNSASQVKSILAENIELIQNNQITIDGWTICGTRGWTFPIDAHFSEHDHKIYAREQTRLKLSLDAAKRKLYNNIIVMMHFPPIYNDFLQTEFERIISSYPVKNVIFGHLHGIALKQVKMRDFMHNNICYNLVSADYLDFKLKQII